MRTWPTRKGGREAWGPCTFAGSQHPCAHCCPRLAGYTFGATGPARLRRPDTPNPLGVLALRFHICGGTLSAPRRRPPQSGIGPGSSDRPAASSRRARARCRAASRPPADTRRPAPPPPARPPPPPPPAPPAPPPAPGAAAPSPARGEKIKAHQSVTAVAGVIPDVAERLSSVLRGWGAYFRWGHSRAVFCKVDDYVRRRFALCLRRIFGRQGTGWSWRTPAGEIMTIRRFLKVLGLYELCGTERPLGAGGAAGHRRAQDSRLLGQPSRLSECHQQLRRFRSLMLWQPAPATAVFVAGGRRRIPPQPARGAGTPRAPVPLRRRVCA